MRSLIHVDFMHGDKPYKVQGRAMDGEYVITVIWIKYRCRGYPGWRQKPIYERLFRHHRPPSKYVEAVLLSAAEALRRAD